MQLFEALRYPVLLTNKYRRQGAAYIAYDAWGNNHAVLVERMTPDYHDSLGAEFSSGQISPVREAAMGISTDTFDSLDLKPNLTNCYSSPTPNAPVLQ